MVAGIPLVMGLRTRWSVEPLWGSKHADLLGGPFKEMSHVPNDFLRALVLSSVWGPVVHVVYNGAITGL